MGSRDHTMQCYWHISIQFFSHLLQLSIHCHETFDWQKENKTIDQNLNFRHHKIVYKRCSNMDDCCQEIHNNWSFHSNCTQLFWHEQSQTKLYMYVHVSVLRYYHSWCCKTAFLNKNQNIETFFVWFYGTKMKSPNNSYHVFSTIVETNTTYFISKLQYHDMQVNEKSWRQSRHMD